MELVCLTHCCIQACKTRRQIDTNGLMANNLEWTYD